MVGVFIYNKFLCILPCGYIFCYVPTQGLQALYRTKQKALRASDYLPPSEFLPLRRRNAFRFTVVQVLK